VSQYAVAIDRDAENDLEDIANYIAEHDSSQHALDVVANIERQIERLAPFPGRGAHPKELVEYGNRDFREISFKPYRILYRVLGRQVVVVLIADGRRDMRSLLARRLLSA
jgi:toxin ParE1/3/4